MQRYMVVVAWLIQKKKSKNEFAYALTYIINTPPRTGYAAESVIESVRRLDKP